MSTTHFYTHACVTHVLSTRVHLQMHELQTTNRLERPMKPYTGSSPENRGGGGGRNNEQGITVRQYSSTQIGAEEGGGHIIHSENIIRSLV